MERGQDHFDELLAFRVFRSNVIAFLRLPVDVSESTLRDALQAISPNLLASYKRRATQATLIWASTCRSHLQSLHPADSVSSAAAAP